MTAGPPRVELYVRPLAPVATRETQETVIETLQTLDAENRLRDFELALCGDCVCPTLTTAATDIGEHLLDRYDSFQQWASDNDRELTGFEERDMESLLTGTTATGVVFPHLTLAEYRGGDLVFVALSANGTERTTVTDRLETY